MDLKEKIEKDLKEALKSKDEFKVGALRFLLSSIKNKEIEKRGKGEGEVLSEKELEDLLRKEAKKRKESFDVFSNNGRGDLASREEGELKILEEYLPPSMSDEEILKIVNEVVAELQPASRKDFGRVMGEVIKRTGGFSDASKVSEMVKSKIPN